MNILEKSNFIGTVFMGGVKAQLKQEWTWAAAAAIGLTQGLKYKGSIRTGLSGGVAVVTVLAAANGIYNIAAHWDKIKEALKAKEE